MQVGPCREVQEGSSGWAPSKARAMGISQGRTEAGSREQVGHKERFTGDEACWLEGEVGGHLPP